MSFSCRAYVFYGVEANNPSNWGPGERFIPPLSWHGEKDPDEEFRIRVEAKLGISYPDIPYDWTGPLPPELQEYYDAIKKQEAEFGIGFFFVGHYEYQHLVVYIPDTLQSSEWEVADLSTDDIYGNTDQEDVWPHKIKEFCKFMDLQMVGDPAWKLAPSYYVI